MDVNTEELELKQAEAEDYSCPQCGAPVSYNPNTCMLECSYCGFKQKIDGQTSDEEFSFEDADKNADSSWNADTKVIKCENCGAENVVANDAISSTCPFCGSNQVIDTSELAGIKPHRIIPFQVSLTDAKATYIKWVKKRFFSPKAVKKQRVKVNVSGVYLPIWTFDTDTFTKYDGYLGEYYTVTVGSGKNRHTVTRTRWFRISGTTQLAFDDIVINAGVQITQSEINRISPFGTNESYLYEKKYLVGFTAEHYHVKLNAAWDNAKTIVAPKIKMKILSKYHYDVVGKIDMKTNYNNIKYKYVLIPVWIGTYRYNNKTYRFLVNGETGKLSGKAPTSALKVTILVLLIVLVAVAVLLIAYFSGSIE